MAKFAQKRANSAIATFALVAKLCKFHICNILAPGKFGANSIFHPVLDIISQALQETFGVDTTISETAENPLSLEKERDVLGDAVSSGRTIKGDPLKVHTIQNMQAYFLIV